MGACRLGEMAHGMSLVSSLRGSDTSSLAGSPVAFLMSTGTQHISQHDVLYIHSLTCCLPVSMGTEILNEQAGDPSFHVISNLARLLTSPQSCEHPGIPGKSKWRARGPGTEVAQALGKYLSWDDES